jgi:hypothetical protein
MTCGSSADHPTRKSYMLMRGEIWAEIPYPVHDEVLFRSREAKGCHTELGITQPTEANFTRLIRA